MKVVELEKLENVIRGLKSKGKRIVLCHGCFDLMHPGHIKYFQVAKDMGDVLVVTVTPDIYVDKGPGRPAFNQGLRVDSIAALECVDYVAINKWPTAEETLKLLKPHIYVKGQEFEKLEDKTGKIQKEFEVIKEIGAELRFTQEIVFSSTELLEKFFDLPITQINADERNKQNESMSSVKSEGNGNKDKDERTYKIIGAAMEVHRELSCGFLEPVYQEALDTEFKNQEIPYKAQPVVGISYKESILEKKYQPDFVCFNEVIVEIKALSKLTGTEESQIINYLKATGLKVGLLINFGSKSLEYKRYVYNY